MYHALVVRPVIVILRSILTAAFLVGGAIAAEPVPADPVQFDISGQPLRDALVEFARQSDRELLFATDVAEDKVANYVAGTYEPEDALELLLADTGLEYSVTANDTILVAEEDGGSDPGNARTKPILMAQSQTSVEQNQTSRRTETDSDEDKRKRPLEEIVVTGTNIRGIAPESSPVHVYDREDIQISGAATAQDFIQTLTANFGGGANANIPLSLPNDISGGANSGSFGSFGSSVNLRGLGSGSTLVLLNGRRVAPASFNGDFVDISMIPASAIERVETLTDGASSIYGSDAVAGVVNFILRDDFDGLETSLRFGTGTQHGTPDQYRGSVTGGQNWGSGHALLVYEFFDQDQLSVEDRRFAQKDFLPNFLLPSQQRHSVLASAAQDVTANLELFADFTYANRKARQRRTRFNSDVTSQFDASSENVNISAGGIWNIFSNWYFDFSGTYSKVDTRNQTSLNTDRLQVTDADVWAADARLSGSLFHLPAGDVKLAFGGHFRTESFLSEAVEQSDNFRDATRDVYALFGEAFIPVIGPDNTLPGVERLEINASGRFEDYSDFGTTTNPKVGLLWSPFGGLNFRGTYSTSFKAPILGIAGSDRGASALRTSFLNPLLDLTAPDPSLEDAVVLTASGPAMDLDPETSRAFTAGLDFQQQWGAHSLALSATWFDIDFEDRLGRTPIPENRNLFDAVNIAFVNPDVFPEGTVVFSPTADEISAFLDSLDTLGTPFGDDPFDAVAINFAAVTRNLSRTIVSGYDFDLTYTYDFRNGSLLLGLDGTFLQDSKQQAITTTPVVEQVNTLFNPVDLKLRARTGYSRNNFAANIFINYVDNYRVDSTAEAEPIESWTTVDVSLAYETRESLGISFLNNTVFRLSVINLFDEDPPPAPVNPNLQVDGFDPTNASPLGRFIAFEITKRW